MLFNSIHFLLFFPIICLIYFCLPGLRVRNLFLLASSYYFYMNWEPVYALLLLGSTTITFLAGLGIEASQKNKWRKTILTSSLVLNIGILFLYKYFDFAALCLENGLDHLGINIDIPEFPFLLPVGISFYIFQAIGYSIDVYRKNTPAEKNFFTYALFVSFFPQLVAGPIERSTHLLPQFKCIHRPSHENLMAGLKLMVWGYFLKLALADRCGLYVDAIFNNTFEHNGSSHLLASLIFPFQIYGDFSGYSLIAIGTARIMGFRLMDNFRRPYLACSISEFWHRWHISLSTWFKDYVYIPLGGNRVGRARQYFNLMVTFLISGLWHGANWTFILWGGIHGIFQCIEKFLGWNRIHWKGVSKILHWVLTFSIVSLAWIFFRANSVKEALYILNSIFTQPGIPFLVLSDLFAIAMSLGIVFFKEFSDEKNISLWRNLSRKTIPSRKTIIEYLWIVGLTAYILLFGVLNGDQFIYFQF